MSTLSSAKRRQPERATKSQAARQHMSTRKPKNGMLSVTPSSYYLTIAKRNAEESDLLRLPPEIRNRIWGYVVSVEHVYGGDLILGQPYDMKDYSVPSVFYACRQMYADSCLLLYSLNDFRVHDDSSSVRWLDEKLPQQLAAFRRITIACSDSHALCLQRFPGLISVRAVYICNRRHVDNTTEGQSVIDTLKKISGKDGLEVVLKDMESFAGMRFR
ncbi:hypothetical protein BKA58DRAFT_378884 [Alternaria rosae]|uniref:uncharacterized protein n=1 Tax=Alternaria rosae TaxID=1187941 RepID=UPI001E8E9E4C|nr:uncharacterized protein BKA58DRAFT_378884 [Alternaria rosae]KAH6879229.1 hypothetical protein BKA58DRAFT_378884 [Alternaria rosae]